MYRSPFTILPALENGPLPGRSELLLQRRKLQAEFELQGADSIVVNGQELHRQDVTALFDELQDERRLAFHRALGAQPPLRLFLEKGLIGEGARWQAAPLEDWAEAVSPLFAAAQDVFYRAVINGQALPETLRRFEQLPKLLLPQDTEEAYRSAGRLLVEKKNHLLLLLHRAQSGQALEAGEISGWATPAQLALINALPDEFSQSRYLLADALNNLCVVFDKAKKYKLALRAIEAAAAVRVDGGELRSLIPRNLDLIRRRRGRLFSWPYGWAILALIVGIRIFLALGNSDKGPRDGIQRFEHRPGEPWPEEMRPFMESFQKERNSATFESIALALNTERQPAPDGPLVLHYAALRPHHPGDDPYRPALAPISSGESDPPTAGGRALAVHNRSRWDLVLLGQADSGRWTRAWYLPAGSSHAIPLPAAGRLVLHANAGRDWSEGQQHSFVFYDPPTPPANAELTGGFSRQPANAADLQPSGRLDLLLQDRGEARDSLVVENEGPRRIRLSLR